MFTEGVFSTLSVYVGYRLLDLQFRLEIFASNAIPEISWIHCPATGHVLFPETIANCPFSSGTAFRKEQTNKTVNRPFRSVSRI